MLAGSKDDFVDMAWNPARSSFVSVGTSGKIYVWSRIYKENWSAFAPDFEELEENQARRLSVFSFRLVFCVHDAAPPCMGSDCCPAVS